MTYSLGRVTHRGPEGLNHWVAGGHSTVLDIALKEFRLVIREWGSHLVVDLRSSSVGVR